MRDLAAGTRTELTGELMQKGMPIALEGGREHRLLVEPAVTDGLHLVLG